LLQPLLLCSLPTPTPTMWHIHPQTHNLHNGATSAHGKKSCIWRTAYVQNLTLCRNVRQKFTPESYTLAYEILTRTLSVSTRGQRPNLHVWGEVACLYFSMKT